jgi:hypothetical protein
VSDFLALVRSTTSSAVKKSVKAEPTRWTRGLRLVRRAARESSSSSHGPALERDEGALVEALERREARGHGHGFPESVPA